MIVGYDRLFGSPSYSYYVGFDNIQIGRAQGKFLADRASGTGNPLYLYAGAPSDSNAFRFFKGAWQELRANIADGTFVVQNSTEAVELKDTVSPRCRRFVIGGLLGKSRKNR